MANIERLQQLVRVLEQVRDEKRPFDMEWWADAFDPPSITTPVNECGTASCAAGWAARDPWFRRRGFDMGREKSWWGFWRPAVVLKKKGRITHRGFEAAIEFFALTQEEASDLFGENHSNSIRAAITRVKRMIRKHEKAAA